MIENYQKALRFWSVQLALLLAFVAGLEPFVPAISAHLPESWRAPLVSVVALCIVLARVVKQPTAANDKSHERGYASAYTMGLAVVAAGLVLVFRWLFGWSLVVLLTGCTEPRTPLEEAQRQVCLSDAERASNRRADSECHNADPPQDWDTCTARPAIMAELKVEQEKCR